MIQNRHFDIPLAFVAVLPFGVSPWWILLVFLPFIIIILFLLLNKASRSREPASPNGSRGALKKDALLHERYHIKQVISREQTGAIYLADDTNLNSECAIKEIIDNISDPNVRTEALERFQSDARIFSDFTHSNITPIIDFFTDGNKHYLVTPYIKGYSLLEYLNELRDAVAEEMVIGWAHTICDVLIALHAHQPPIIYQDLKPENIIFVGPQKLVMLSVYGISRYFYADTSGEPVSNPGYAPPEQWQGLAEPRSDLYALGAIMHHLLTGIDPKRKDSSDFPPLRDIKPTLTEDIERIVNKLLQKEVEQRYPSVEELKADLQQLSPQDTSVQPSIAEITASTAYFTPEAIINAIDDAEMILIPEGEFLMGSLPGEGSDDELPQHRVTLDAFYIDKYPVTNAQYKKFIDENSQWRKRRVSKNLYYKNYLRLWSENDYPRGKANHPVVYVTWYAAQAYAEWAGKRLPTEAEWEKAAGGTDGRMYPWGSREPDESNCNFGNKIDDTTHVTRYPAGESPYGVIDIAGNVWEWCEDFYDKDYYKNSPTHNPKGPRQGEVCVCRGGSWNMDQYRLRCAFRRPTKTTSVEYDLGFRCAKSL